MSDDLVVHRLGGRLLVVDGGPGPWRRRAGVGEGDVRFGAADDRALAVLNTVVGNAWPAPALELLVGPLVLRTAGPLVLASDGHVVVDDIPQGSGRPLRLHAGQQVRVTPRGLVATIAIAGGVDAIAGTVLRRDDVIPRRAPAPDDGDLDEAITALAVDDEVPLRVVPGPERELFADEAWTTFLSTTWTVSPASSRQGVRLAGGALPVPGVELTTAPTWTGAVQVPPSGQPIVLGVDSRSTGGYPRLAHVIAVDRFRLAQARPGRPLRFTATTIDEARALRRAFAARWQR